MIRAVLDEVVPADFITLLNDKDIEVAAFPDEWRSLSDGEVLGLALAAGYDWLITCDKQMPFQQNLRGKSLTVMVLPSPRIVELQEIRVALCATLRTRSPGNFVILDNRGKQSGRPIPHMIGRTLSKKS